MIRRTSVSSSPREGLQLRVYELPFWGAILEDHWPAPDFGDNWIDHLWYDLTNWVFGKIWKGEVEIISIPITVEQAEILYPGDFEWLSDDRPPLDAGVPVRLIPRKGTLDAPGMKGVVTRITRTLQDFPGDAEYTVQFENGAIATVSRYDLIDIRLIGEK